MFDKMSRKDNDLLCHYTEAKLFTSRQLEVITLTVDIRGGGDKWADIHLHGEKNIRVHHMIDTFV